MIAQLSEVKVEIFFDAYFEDGIESLVIECFPVTKEIGKKERFENYYQYIQESSLGIKGKAARDEILILKL